MKRLLSWLRGAERSSSANGDPRHELGRRGEELAAAHYRAEGYRILARRWRSACGEVDLVVERTARGQRRELAAVEVKTRRARRRDALDDPIAETRAAQLARVERALLSHPRARPRRLRDGARGPLLRVDLAAVLARTDGVLELRVSRGRPFELLGRRGRIPSQAEARRPERR
ncbi:MAG: YraN family protein [Planctomycetes bacterium]|nr:YraN family protein [Planctomycetota bacterium]